LITLANYRALLTLMAMEKKPESNSPEIHVSGRPDIDAFEAVMMREDRAKGFFVSFDYSGEAMSEIQAFFKKTGKIIRPITVKDIVDSHAFTGVALTFSGCACPATALLKTALTPAFTGGELPRN